MEKEELFNRGVCYEIEIIEKRHCTLMHTGKIWIFCTINEGGLVLFGIWDLVLLRLGFGDLVSLVWDLGWGFAYS